MNTKSPVGAGMTSKRPTSASKGMVHLDARATYLVLHDATVSGERKLSLKPDFESALAGWTVGSRVSPVWRLRSDGKLPLASVSFDDCIVTFAGPVAPARLSMEVPGIEEAESCWATLGCFNIIIHTDCDDEGKLLSRRVVDWALASEVAFEQWTLEAGVIRNVTQHVLPNRTSSVLAKLIEYSEAHRHPTVRANYQENLVATATSLSRAAAVYPPIFDEIETAASSIARIMETFSEGKLTLLEMQSRLLTMNAALSRFSSQAFSGIPPIRGTECHFYIHSLLGTGSANLALASLVASIQHVLGNALLPERLALMEKIKDGTPTSGELASDETLLDFDLLEAVPGPAAVAPQIIPLITYFSGRDDLAVMFKH